MLILYFKEIGLVINDTIRSLTLLKTDGCPFDDILLSPSQYCTSTPALKS